jgi:co-chaperonin GroES (HSP10)
MATLPTLRITSKIEILYFPDIAKEKSQHGEIISVGPLSSSQRLYLN